jgi:hypothetical protein
LKIGSNLSLLVILFLTCIKQKVFLTSGHECGTIFWLTNLN